MQRCGRPSSFFCFFSLSYQRKEVRFSAQQLQKKLCNLKNRNYPKYNNLGHFLPVNFAFVCRTTTPRPVGITTVKMSIAQDIWNRVSAWRMIYCWKSNIYKNTVSHIHESSPCGEKFKTGYSPDGDEIVYCEKCYQQEVY